jgi:hypothetical protein
MDNKVSTAGVKVITYIEVTQGGVSSRAIGSEYLAYYEPKKNSNKKNIKEILCNFLLRTQQYFKFLLFFPLKT